MKQYHEALAELFKLACIYKDTIATANLAKLLELTTSPVEAKAHWVAFRSDLALERLNTHLQHNFGCNSHKSGDVDGQKIGYALRYGKEQAEIILADLEVRRDVPKRTPDEWGAMKKEFNAEIRRLQKLLDA